MKQLRKHTSNRSLHKNLTARLSQQSSGRVRVDAAMTSCMGNCLTTIVVANMQCDRGSVYTTLLSSLVTGLHGNKQVTHTWLPSPSVLHGFRKRIQTLHHTCQDADLGTEIVQHTVPVNGVIVIAMAVIHMRHLDSGHLHRRCRCSTKIPCWPHCTSKTTAYTLQSAPAVPEHNTNTFRDNE